MNLLLAHDVPVLPRGRHRRRPWSGPARWGPWIMCGITAAICGTIAFLGTMVRPTSDDYRLAVYAREHGIWGSGLEFYQRVTGRLGNGLLSGLVYSLPEVLPRVLPPVAFCTFALAVGLLVRAMGRRLGAALSPTTPALVGGGVASITFLGQPGAYQTLFWAPGVITHTIPPIILMTVIALAFRCPPRRGLLLNVAALPVGCLLGTTSEAITLVWYVLAALIVVSHVRFARRITQVLRFTAALTAGFTAGLVLLWSSPGNTLRREGAPSWTQAELDPLDPDLLIDACAMALIAIRDLLSHGYLAAGLALGIMAAVTARGSVARIRPRTRVLGWALACPAVAVFCAAFVVQYSVRFGYGSLGWNVHRVWFNFTFLLVGAVVWYGFLIGAILLSRLPTITMASGLAAASLAVFAGVTSVYAAGLQGLGSSIVLRAVAWDEQAERIERSRSAGETVVKYAPLQIDGLAEPFVDDNAHSWMTEPVARYFKVSAIVEATP